MGTLIYFLVFGIVAYVIFKIAVKEPILPWKDKKKKSPKSNKALANNKSKSKKKNKNASYEEEEPNSFDDILQDMIDVKDHMIWLNDNRFILVAEVIPVNYFLLSPHEQENIDRIFETWTAQLEYPIRLYFQARYIDLTQPMDEIKRNLQHDDLPYNTYEYGMSMLEELQKWQEHSPRYDVRRYILFPFKVDAKEIVADTDEEFEDKMSNKAFQETSRYLNTAKNALHKANIKVNLLTTEGIKEMLYHTFNREKALYNRFKDIDLHENFSLYSTADQDLVHIELVKEMIENVEEEVETTKAG